MGSDREKRRPQSENFSSEPETHTFTFSRLSMNLSSDENDDDLYFHTMKPTMSNESKTSSRARRKPPPDLIEQVQTKNANKVNELNKQIDTKPDQDHSRNSSYSVMDSIIQDLNDEIGKYDISSNPIDNPVDSGMEDEQFLTPKNGSIDDFANDDFANDDFAPDNYGSEGYESENLGNLHRLESSTSVYSDTSSNMYNKTNADSKGSETPRSYNSQSSLSLPLNQTVTPYPLDSPIVPSPTSLTYDTSYSTDSPPNLTPGFGLGTPVYTTESTDSDSRIMNRKSTPNSFNRTYSVVTTNTTKSIPLKPTISTPITNFNSTDSMRNSTNSMTSTLSPTLPSSIQAVHRKSSSMSSIISTSSNRNINFATLKKTMNLKPGEGERSNYVLTLRKNSGTAFNETGPGKWKLPTGIAPIDKRATYTSSNGAYMRMAGGSLQKAKKGSGVELKHGHLAPRLLAAEVDDMEDSRSTSALTRSTTALTTSTTGLEPKDSRENKEPATKVKSSSSSIIVPHTSPSVNSNLSSGHNSLSRTVTETSTNSVTNSKDVEKRSSVSSDSSGSISDDDVQVGRFYQHPSYKYDDEEIDESKEDQNEEEQSTLDNDDEPKLFLANPDDIDSD